MDKRYLFLLIGMILIVLVIIFVNIIFFNSSDDTTSSIRIANPAAVYCEELGYEFKVLNNDGGQYGVCVLSSGVECDSWEFFNGKCSPEYTYCERNGGKISITNKKCKYSSECAVCALSNGTECYEWDYFQGQCSEVVE